MQMKSDQIKLPFFLTTMTVVQAPVIWVDQNWFVSFSDGPVVNTSTAGGMVSIPGLELRSHMSCHVAQKKKKVF